MIEYRIRRGNGSCDYSGNQSPVLIQLVDAAGQPSGWMGAEALNEALSLLNALSGIAASQPVYSIPTRQEIPEIIPAQPAPVATVAAAPVQPKGKLSVRDEVSLESFAQACQKLADNPPADKDGNVNGVPGYAVRELVQQWRGRFQAGDRVMVPAIKNFFGVPDGQVDFLMGKMD